MKNNNDNKITAAVIIIILIIAAVTTTTPPAAVIVMAQLQQPQSQQQRQSQQQQGEVFESEEDGFRLQIPEGWVIQDHDIISTPEPNTRDAAVLCLESEALPAVGGGANCQAGALTDIIAIVKWPDLQSMPEFENVSMPTTNDLVALYVQFLQSTNQTSDIQIVNSTDVDEFTKIINMTYIADDDAGTAFNPFDDSTNPVKSLQMFKLSQENRNVGYFILNNLAIPTTTTDIYNQTAEHSPAVNTVFNSFEIVEE